MKDDSPRRPSSLVTPRLDRGAYVQTPCSPMGPADEPRGDEREEANVEEFQRFCDMIGERAAARGLTEETLAELLAEP